MGNLGGISHLPSYCSILPSLQSKQYSAALILRAIDREILISSFIVMSFVFNKKRSTIADASRGRQYARDGALQVTYGTSAVAFYPSNSPLGGLLPAPPWLSPPSVMSSSPDAAAAAVGSTFCQLTSSENWRLNLAATVQPSRLLPLAAFSI